MDALNTFLSLLARTQGRDKSLRLVQYLTVGSVQDKTPGSAKKVYDQVRMTRKLLRFLRSLEYSTQIKEQFPKLVNSLTFPPSFLKYLTSILQNLFTVLYYLSDHRVCLGELGVIDKSHVAINLPRSMKFYFLQNLFGAIRNLIQISTQIMKSLKKSMTSQIANKIRCLAFDFIKCVLDCFVALFYWKGSIPAQRVRLIGTITSVMAILQSLGYFVL